MKRNSVFLIAGIGAGLATVLLGVVWKVSLAFSGGLFFAIALFLSLCVNDRIFEFRRHALRYSVALIACIPAYILVVFTIASVSQFLADTFHLERSADIQAPRIDLILGILAAFWFAALLVELLAYALTRLWSSRAFVEDLLLGTGALSLSVLINAPIHQYWVIVTALIISAQTIFVWRVGRRVAHP